MYNRTKKKNFFFLKNEVQKKQIKLTKIYSILNLSFCKIDKTEDKCTVHI
jgi:hypothetical protein